MKFSKLKQGLGRLSEVLPQALFPVSSQISAGVDPKTVKELQQQATIQLGLGMMAARDRGAGLGSGLGYAFDKSRDGLNQGLGQVYTARRDQRQEERQNSYDERFARAEQRGIADNAWDQAFREREFGSNERDSEFDRGIKQAQLRIDSLDKGSTGTWSQPFEAMDATSGKPGMFQSHSLSGEIRPATVGAGKIGPKSREGSDSIAPESLIWRQSVAYFGGIIDPETGKITGLDPTQTARTQELASRASRIYKDGGGQVTAAEAVQKAISGRSEAQPTNELPQEASARLREGIVTTFKNGQRWTLRNGQAVKVN